MKMFTGTKMVKATPMTRAQYNAYRGWELPKDENGEDEGYLVEDTDGGTPNHPDHAGYISWSPVPQFLRTYMEVSMPTHLEPFQQRVIQERAELAEKLDKLLDAMKRPTFLLIPLKDRELLAAQSRSMTSYLNTLDRRIERFWPEFNQPEE